MLIDPFSVRIFAVGFAGQHTRCIRVIVSHPMYLSSTVSKEHSPICTLTHRKPLHEELINLRRKLALLAQKPTGYTAAEVNEIQEKVRSERKHVVPCCALTHVVCYV